MTLWTFSFSDSLALVKSRLQATKGQTMAEYAVVLGVISLIVISAFGLLSTAISSAIITPITAL